MVHRPGPAGRATCRDEASRLGTIGYGPGMEGTELTTRIASVDRAHTPSHVPSGAALLALALSEQARGIRGLDVLRRSVDRAPPKHA
jgi:hypothetical protein